LQSLRNKRIFVAGHGGLVGGAVARRLRREGCTILTVPRVHLDLRRQAAVEEWFAREKPNMVVLAAARVGGIGANAKSPADFIYDNMMIEANVIDAAYRAGVEKLLFLGSSCIYPRMAAQPMTEEALLSGALEPTNEAYAVAKIAGIKLCQSYRRQHGCDFIAAMPCNLYGPGDRYDAEGSHVIPAMMMKMHNAREKVTLWGTGAPLREFMYVDDLADALVFLLQNYSGEEIVNVGSGQEVSIRQLAALVADVTGYEGTIVFDASRPDGTPRKVMDGRRLRALGWNPEFTGLRDGLRLAYADFSERVRDVA
jgi:GDP-L-fucose synthase